MDIVDTIINVLVVAAVGGLLSLQTRGLRAELAEFRREFRADLAEHRRENLDSFAEHGRENLDSFAQDRQEHADIRRELAGLRSALTQVALAVGAKPRASGDR